MASDEFDALIKLMRETSAEAVPAAENAAAKVYMHAAIAAAPVSKPRQNFKVLPKHPSGQLRMSVKVIEGRRLKTLTGDTRQRLFVGPEKKKGYYGYFVEKGYTAMGRAGRRERKATATTHGQKGATGGRKIPGRPWFEPSQRAADSSAEQAAQAAFDAKLQELDSRIA